MSRRFGFYWSPNSDQLEAELELLAYTGANTLYVSHRHLSRVPVDRLRDLGIRLLVDWSIFAGEHLQQRFPDSVPINAEGQPYARDQWYVPVCPNHPQIRSEHLREMTKLLDRDEVTDAQILEGFWLDFIRFPIRWEGAEPTIPPMCFCRRCLNLFLQQEREAYSPQETRALASEILSERLDEWVAWKCDCIAAFVREVRALINTQNRPLVLGIFAIPWRRSDFNGAIRSVVGQDLALLARDVDIFSPMVYHKLCHQPPVWIEDVVLDHAEWSQKTVLPIIQSVHQPDTMTPHELDAALSNALRASPDGAMIFTLAPLVESRELAEVVRAHFV